MNPDLFNTLLQRQMSQTEQQPQPVPAFVPNIPAKVPQQAKRFENAQKIQEAYANNWNPNPVLLRAMLGHR